MTDNTRTLLEQALDADHAIVSESSCNQMRASVREAQRRINQGVTA